MSVSDESVTVVAVPQRPVGIFKTILIQPELLAEYIASHDLTADRIAAVALVPSYGLVSFTHALQRLNIAEKSHVITGIHDTHPALLTVTRTGPFTFFETTSVKFVEKPVYARACLKALTDVQNIHGKKADELFFVGYAHQDVPMQFVSFEDNTLGCLEPFVSVRVYQEQGFIFAVPREERTVQASLVCISIDRVMRDPSLLLSPKKWIPVAVSHRSPISALSRIKNVDGQISCTANLESGVRAELHLFRTHAGFSGRWGSEQRSAHRWIGDVTGLPGIYAGFQGVGPDTIELCLERQVASTRQPLRMSRLLP